MEMCHEGRHFIVGIEQLDCNSIIASPVAKDAKEVLRDNQVFCSQFVIHNPDPRVALNHMRDCCAFGPNIRDCKTYDWSSVER
jgi:hypothetical protein